MKTKHGFYKYKNQPRNPKILNHGNIKTNHRIPKYELQPTMEIWKPTKESTNMKTNQGTYKYENQK